MGVYYSILANSGAYFSILTNVGVYYSILADVRVYSFDLTNNYLFFELKLN